ncbi:GNAT family N-acetyltransferase [Staphylococcus pseudoxylosus]|uniref:GNAT family N-acetyltransferase n=1 Tax=Staphylococcus pseudoxylosus TaxID=2282419 RepID=UPI003905A159
MYYRRLIESDVKQYRKLRLKSLQTDPKGFASTYKREVGFPLDKFKSRIISSETQFTMGAFDDATLVCIGTFYSEPLEKVKHKGNLVSIYCDPSYRRQGIASLLIKKTINEVNQLGFVKIIGLCVISENKSAIALYEQLGFKWYGTEPKALFDGNSYYDEDLMYMEL